MRASIIISGSFVSALLLYQALGPDIPILTTLAVIGLLMIPFLLLNFDFSEKALVAVLTLTLPFNVDQALFLRETHVGGSQGLILSLNGICITLLYLLRFLRSIGNSRNVFHVPKDLTLLFLGIIVMCVLSMANARDRALSLFETLEVCKMLLIFLYMVNFARSKENIRWMILFLVLGVALEGGIAIMQRATQSTLGLKMLGADEETVASAINPQTAYRAGGTLGGANALAWYLDYLLPLLFSLIFLRKKTLHQMMLFGALGLGGMGLIFTLSRGGWLGALLGISLVLLFLISKAPMIMKLYGSVCVVLLAMLGTALLFGIDNPVKTRLTRNDEGSAESRIPLMQIAWNMIKARPFIGHGVNNYVLADHEYDDTALQITTHFHFPVHNFYLQTAAEIGIPGLLLFLLFAVRVISRLLRLAHHSDALYRTFGMGVLGGIGAAAVQGLVENCCIGNYILTSFWYLAGMTEGMVTMDSRGTS